MIPTWIKVVWTIVTALHLLGLCFGIICSVLNDWGRARWIVFSVWVVLNYAMWAAAQVILYNAGCAY